LKMQCIASQSDWRLSLRTRFRGHAPNSSRDAGNAACSAN